MQTAKEFLQEAVQAYQREHGEDTGFWINFSMNESKRPTETFILLEVAEAAIREACRQACEDLVWKQIEDFQDMMAAENLDRETQLNENHLSYNNVEVQLYTYLENSLPKPEQEEKCVTGCKIFTGGEKKHHKDCPFYPGSLSEMHDQQEEDQDSLWAKIGVYLIGEGYELGAETMAYLKSKYIIKIRP